ncbi:hypothetical protein DPMN_000498 [Dreissena polymorpha]|uniref:Beta-1,4-galactosyltransferase n=1 Tax=Dreissena polymorpha TaxID=45954 RepID=A0A9D4MFY5_DREPO|nr:hypothetical protein DPMN_000498 [Dreissena polymorpha]
MYSYSIFDIIKDPSGAFNRAKLFNVGYNESSKYGDFDCFIFHDVDLIPENDTNLYQCEDQPKHMSPAMSSFNYRIPYSSFVGGVLAMNKTVFQLVNGFSNLYLGWGGEDDDMSVRILENGFKVRRPPLGAGRYKMIRHQKEIPSQMRFKLLEEAKTRMATEGLNSLQYNLPRKIAFLITGKDRQRWRGTGNNRDGTGNNRDGTVAPPGPIHTPAELRQRPGEGHTVSAGGVTVYRDLPGRYRLSAGLNRGTTGDNRGYAGTLPAFIGALPATTGALWGFTGINPNRDGPGLYRQKLLKVINLTPTITVFCGHVVVVVYLHRLCRRTSTRSVGLNKSAYSALIHMSIDINLHAELSFLALTYNSA